ncbi:MAG TPA: diacylglycerol kinase family protein [Anaerolineaceae bacterium]|nr:diacylglycerol kinase [Anaerolineaceae bacterium]HUM49353.1 diacylglycerol kinase family protein [Anaerolineaceae bacterium]
MDSVVPDQQPQWKKPSALKLFIHSRGNSFKYAGRGLRYVMRTQKNAWIHSAVMIVVMILSFWLQLARLEWVAILLVIGMVWTAEFINTSLESIVNMASPERHPLAQVGKDVAAAAVLFAAIIAVIVGILVLGPHLQIKLGL